MKTFPFPETSVFGPGPSWRDMPPAEKRQSAVALPLFKKDGDLRILCLERARELSRHPGEVGFPGGAREDADRGPVQTCLREMNEELGIPDSLVKVMGLLPSECTFSSDFVIFPVVCILNSDLRADMIRIDPGEVRMVLDVGLSDLAAAPEMKWGWYGDRPFMYPRFPVGNGYVIWGASARILWRLLRLMRHGLLWP
ncbi:MAG: CoA pyrophosphatase [Synergistota bacterium]|nr:CoA pyrophosphatase [Synergistota bacterium]